MTDPHNPIRDDRLEAYLDGSLAAADRVAFEAALHADPDRSRQIELQGRIDASLTRMFRAGPPADERVLAILAAANRDAAQAPLRTIRLGWAAAGLAAAAVFGWLVLANPFSGSRTDSPNFAARPLADLYRETVANGFEPGYECEEADRFADAFFRRQGLPLKLLRLPIGTRMLGLSYVGGLSPETTAMLGQVDGQRVMVFVDRADADRPEAIVDTDEKLRIFRQTRDGLVFYEVTPLDRPRMIEFLAPASAEGASELPPRKSAG